MITSQRVVKDIDVICQFKADGTIIPLRFRTSGEDGQYRIYKILEYREVPKKGAYTTKDGIFVGNNTEILECRIQSFGRDKIVRLYYEPKKDGKWMLGIG